MLEGGRSYTHTVDGLISLLFYRNRHTHRTCKASLQNFLLMLPNEWYRSALYKIFGASDTVRGGSFNRMWECNVTGHEKIREDQRTVHCDNSTIVYHNTGNRKTLDCSVRDAYSGHPSTMMSSCGSKYHFINVESCTHIESCAHILVQNSTSLGTSATIFS